MVKVLIKADSRFPIKRKKIRQAVRGVLMENGVEGEVEVSVSIVGDRKMKLLNQKYLKRNKTTSVLSFSLENSDEDSGLGFAEFPDDVLRLGDIVISYPQVLNRAVKKNIFMDEEIERLVRHGMRHLLGIG